MAINSRVSQAADALAGARTNPLVQKVVSDQDLHDSVRSAVGAAQSLFGQLQSNASASTKLTNDRLFDELQTLAVSLRDAGDSLRGATAAPRRRAGLGFGKVIGLGVAGGAVALAASENLRGKVLDTLFGAEEEFQYTPSSAVNGTAQAAAPKTATNGNGAGSKEAATAAAEAAAKPAAKSKSTATKSKPAAKKPAEEKGEDA